MVNPRAIGVIVYNGFETLDVYGPLGLLCFQSSPSVSQSPFTATFLKQPGSASTLKSSSSLPTEADATLSYPPNIEYDILLIPGGFGNRPLLKDREFLTLLRKNAEDVLRRGGIIFCVCTGSILLAATGLLDGREATTNKVSYDALTPSYPSVKWKRKARWVIDGQIITSSGITAGMVHLLWPCYRF